MKPNVEDAKREWEYIYEKVNISNISTDGNIIDCFYYSVNNDIEWNNGCTRMVCWRTEGDYVFKIDIGHDSETELNWTPSPEKNGTFNCDSDTEKEWEVYKDACARGLEDLFAWEDYIGAYPIKGGYIHIYAMEKVEVDYDQNENDSRNSYEAAHSVEESMEIPYYFFSDQEYMLLLAKHEWNDESLFEEFLELLNDCEVNDLHAGNWGRRDGRLVVTDYAGF